MILVIDEPQWRSKVWGSFWGLLQYPWFKLIALVHSTQREAPKDLNTDEGTETTCVVSVSILRMPSTPGSGTPRGKIPTLPIHSPLLSAALSPFRCFWHILPKLQHQSPSQYRKPGLREWTTFPSRTLFTLILHLCVCFVLKGAQLESCLFSTGYYFCWPNTDSFQN